MLIEKKNRGRFFFILRGGRAWSGVETSSSAGFAHDPGSVCSPLLAYTCAVQVPFEASPRTLASREKAPRGLFFARGTGLEPATFRVHIPPYFRRGMDYIFTIGFPLGIPVSSLYGAPMRIMGFPRYSHIQRGLSLHRYPGKFQPPFRRGSCTSTGGCSDQLSYPRTLLSSLKTRIARSSFSRFRGKNRSDSRPV